MVCWLYAWIACIIVDLCTNKGRTHRFYTGTPVYAFGTGLSYTTFTRSLTWAGPVGNDRNATPKLSMISDSNGQPDPEAIAATLTATVVNNGSVAGDEVLLVFIKPPSNAVALGAPSQQLSSFLRVSLAAGESATRQLHIKQAHVWSILPQQAQVALAKLGHWQIFANADEHEALRFTINARH